MNFIVVIILNIYIFKSLHPKLHTLKLHNVMCQVYLNKIVKNILIERNF